ncbi:MAG: HK97 gp10 family phage protein [Candidatus Scalindua sp.]|nr:HK97 gp10 family phage protein [Candidatus Scalindua sp.]
MSVTVKWYGDKYSKQMIKGVKKGLHRSINIVDADIKLLTPVRTGDLRGANKKNVDEVKLIATETNDKEYAPNVEFGTRYQKANPFFRTGFVKNIRKIMAIFKAEGKEAIGN